MKIFKCIKIIGLIIWGANLLLGSTLIASAGEGDNLFSWAWNSEAGWISFNNCVYGGGCSGYSYGVNLNEGSYALSGYAWSSNVGWISFNDSGTGIAIRRVVILSMELSSILSQDVLVAGRKFYL